MRHHIVAATAVFTATFALLTGCATAVSGSAKPGPSSRPAAPAVSWAQLDPCQMVDRTELDRIGIVDTQQSAYGDDRDCLFKMAPDTGRWEASLENRNYRTKPYKHAPLPGGYTDTPERPVIIAGRSGGEFNQGDLGDCHVYVQLNPEHALHVDFGATHVEPGDPKSQDPKTRHSECVLAEDFATNAVQHLIQLGVG